MWPEKNPLEQYLEEFIAELLQLTNNGFHIGGARKDIIVRSFCCDVPAKSFLKQTKGHNGFQGCDKCVDRGIYINRRMTFTNFSAEKRTDDNFRSKSYIEHHIGMSPLGRLDIDLVKSFPIDYMHNVCLGVMRKLLF